MQHQRKQVTPVVPLWSVEEASAYLGVPVSTLYQWRYRRIGPPSYRVGRYVRYDASSVRAWLEAQVA